MDNGYISNEELANILNVTTQTIRRDIRVLSQMKLILYERRHI